MSHINKNLNKKNQDIPDGFVLLSDVEKQNLVSYTAEYLSLRIRQGKLQGEKFGRSWYTRAEWLDEYVELHSAKEIRNTAVIAREGNPDRGNLNDVAGLDTGNNPYGDVKIAASTSTSPRNDKSGADQGYDYGIPKGYEIDEFKPTKLRKPFKFSNISRAFKNQRGEFVKFKNKIFKKKSKDILDVKIHKPFAHRLGLLTTKLLAVGLTITLLFVFIGSPKAMAHWASEKANQAIAALSNAPIGRYISSINLDLPNIDLDLPNIDLALPNMEFAKNIAAWVYDKGFESYELGKSGTSVIQSSQTKIASMVMTTDLADFAEGADNLKNFSVLAKLDVIKNIPDQISKRYQLKKIATLKAINKIPARGWSAFGRQGKFNNLPKVNVLGAKKEIKRTFSQSMHLLSTPLLGIATVPLGSAKNAIDQYVVAKEFVVNNPVIAR